MRRALAEPVSRASSLAPRLSLFGGAVALLAALGLRFGWLDLLPGLAAMAAGLVLALLGVLAALVAFLRIWQEGKRGLRPAVMGLLLGLAILAGPAWFGLQGAAQPLLSDVSTDPDDPPAFSRQAVAFAGRGGFRRDLPDEATRARQRSGYPDLTPLVIGEGADAAFDLVLKAVEARGWQVVARVPPGGRMRIGHVDAVARSFLLRLPDDVTIRLRPVADGTRIDIRSASRIGPGDLGANAARIEALLDDITAMAKDE